MRHMILSHGKQIAPGNTPFFGGRTGQVQAGREKAPFFQLKDERMTVGTPGGRYEQEAEAMADAVAAHGSGPAVPLSGGPAEVRRKCEACAEEEQLQAGLQRKENGQEPDVQGYE